MARTLSSFARNQTDTSSERLLEIAYTLQVIASGFFQIRSFLQCLSQTHISQIVHKNT